MSIVRKGLLIGTSIIVLTLWAAWQPRKDHPTNPVRIRGLFRFVNWVGRTYEALFQRPLFPLDPGKLEPELRSIKKAEHEVYGSPKNLSELNGLRALFQGFASPGSLPSTLGKLLLMRRFRKKLEHRRQIIAYVRSHPEVLEVPIRRPLIISGLPRTGTTFLQRLMATDPRVRSPHLWVMMIDPSPRPPTEDEITNLSDPRLESMEKRFLKSALISPDHEDLYKKYHAVKLTNIDEESSLMSDCMWNNTGTYVGEDDSFWRWILNNEEDKTYMYRYVKVWLQIQSSTYAPRSHWLLKTPAHSFFLPTLAQEFPDANLVFIHRDPCSVVASACKLNSISHILIMDYHKYVPQGHGQKILQVLKAAGDLILRFYNHESDISKRALHLVYEDLTADPIGTVERIYEHFGYQMTDQFRANMRDYLAQNRQHKHGKPNYSLEEFGLDKAAVDKAFEDYNKTFRNSNGVLSKDDGSKTQVQYAS